jgi:BTB/POZ domain-containing protein 9
VGVSLPNNLSGALWGKEDLTDIAFIVDGERVPAHKLVLASQSEYFRVMLYGEMKEASQEEIVLSDVPLAPFKKLLQYAYTGVLELDEPLEDILEVTRVANFLGFAGLSARLGRDTAYKNVSLDTFLHLYVFSDTHDLPQMKTICLSFTETVSNTLAVLKSPSFLQLPMEFLVSLISNDIFVAPEYDILQAVLQWRDVNQKSTEEMDAVTKCIRLSRFIPREIFTKVEPTGLFNERRILTAVRVLDTPDLSQTQPRGRFEPEKNVLLLSQVHFDPPTLPSQPPYTFQFGADYTATITLPRNYLLNILFIEPFPDSPAEQSKFWYSYIISVSLNRHTWLKLFDYTSAQCRGRQQLMFPKIPVRYIQIAYFSQQKNYSKLIMRVSTLHYTNVHTPFKFLSNGVIAPLDDYKVATFIHSRSRGNGHIALACFHQPYSASFVRIHVLYTDASVTDPEADVKVILGHAPHGGHQKIVRNVKKVDLK